MSPRYEGKPTGQSAAGLVDQGGGVVGEQLVAAPGQFQVVGQVVAGLGFGHPGQAVAQRDPLVQRGERAELDPPPQGGLAQQ